MTEPLLKSPSKNQSLVTALSIPLVILSIAALIVTFIVQVFFYVPTQRTIINTEQNLIVHEAVDVVDGFLEERFSEMETLSFISNLSSASPQEQATMLENLLGLDRSIRQIVLYDAVYRKVTTISRLSSVSSVDPAIKINHDVFVQVRQADRYVSRVYVDDKTNEPLVVMAIPLLNVFDEFQGLLLIEVNLKFMWDLVASLQVGENGYAYVVDNRGNLLAARETSRVLLQENLRQIAIVQDYMSASAEQKEAVSFMMQGINGTQAVGTYLPVPNVNWAVVTELPWQEAFQDGIRALALIVLVMIILAGVIGWAGVTLARRLATPIVALTQISSRIANGELALQAPVSGPREISSLAESFNLMTAQLRQSLVGLTRRTQALETSQEVSRRLAEIFDERQLVAAVVNEVQTAFNYYHAHIYLFDETRQNLHMVGGTGEAGRQMLLAGHKIPRGRGLVGRAAEIHEVVLISDVAQAPEWLPNPLLPDTRSEVAVPIVLGDTVYGVLDVQQNFADGLTQDDAQLLEGIANQVAIALQNARSYAQARQEAEQEALINAISQKIQQANTIETILQVASRELALGLGAKKSTVQLHSPQKTLKPSGM